MSLPKGSENPPKKSKWIKKGWVVKKVTNPVGCCCATGTQPAAKCPYCELYPCYADAYGSYRCPRCGKSFRLSVPTLTRMMSAPGSARTCPKCNYYPCYYDTTTGCYRCPKGHLFQ